MKHNGISLEEVLKDKNLVRRSQIHADAFTFFYKEKFGKEPSFCCTFKDFDLLKNSLNVKTIQKMETNKFKVLYPTYKTLWYKKDKKTHRAYAGKASNDFIENFVKHHDKNVFDDVSRFIVENNPKQIAKLEEVVEHFETIENLDIAKTSVKDLLPIIHSSSLEELVKFDSDLRASIIKAVKSRRDDLNGKN